LPSLTRQISTMSGFHFLLRWNPVIRPMGIPMLDELVARLPSVDDLLSLAVPQLDDILLKCIAQ